MLYWEIPWGKTLEASLCDINIEYLIWNKGKPTEQTMSRERSALPHATERQQVGVSAEMGTQEVYSNQDVQSDRFC